MVNVISPGFPRNSQGKTGIDIILFEEVNLSLNPRRDYPLFIIMQQSNSDIGHILLDLGISTDILF